MCKVRCACNEPLSFLNSNSTQVDSSAPPASMEENKLSDDENVNEPLPNGDILFNCDESGFVKGSDYDALIEDLKKKAEIMDSLYIFGFYSLEETNRSKYENLGLARAGAIRQQLRSDLDYEMMSIESMEKPDVGTNCDEPFKAVRFLWE